MHTDVARFVDMGLVAKRDDVKEGLRVGAEVLEVLDPNEKQLRDEYGVPPDRGGR